LVSLCSSDPSFLKNCWKRGCFFLETAQKLLNLLKNSQKRYIFNEKAIFRRIIQNTAFSSNLDFKNQFSYLIIFNQFVAYETVKNTSFKTNVSPNETKKTHNFHAVIFLFWYISESKLFFSDTTVKVNFFFLIHQWK